MAASSTPSQLTCAIVFQKETDPAAATALQAIVQGQNSSSVWRTTVQKGRTSIPSAMQQNPSVILLIPPNFAEKNQEQLQFSANWVAKCIQELHRHGAAGRKTFVCVWSGAFCGDASARWLAFKYGANMVSHDPSALHSALKTIRDIQQSCDAVRGGCVPTYTCIHCQQGGLTAEALWWHNPLYHVHAQNIRAQCPICLKRTSNWAVHLHNHHPPTPELAVHDNAGPSTLFAFALVVVQHPHTKKFLLVQEFAESGFFLPGGRVDPGEGLPQAATRETLEEAGVRVRLTGVLKFEFSSGQGYCRMGVIFFGEPEDPDQKPKSIPDYESAGAVWVSADEIDALPLRGSEPSVWVDYLRRGGDIYPMSILAKESKDTSIQTTRKCVM